MLEWIFVEQHMQMRLYEDVKNVEKWHHAIIENIPD